MPSHHHHPDLVDLILHSTGMGLSPGDSDPNWQVALGPAGFPRLQAQVCYEQQIGDRPSRWIWFNPDGAGGQLDQIYVFRNTIDLSNFQEPEEAFRFTLGARGAKPILVAANGHRVHHHREDGEDELPERAEPGHVFEAEYEIPHRRLKQQVNTIDVMVRATEPRSAGIRLEYHPTRGVYSPPVALLVLHGASASSGNAASSPIRVIAAIPQPTTPGRTFQDLTVGLGQPISNTKTATVTVQVVTLDSSSGAIPVGAPQVYDSSHNPSSILTARVLGFSGKRDSVYIRVSSHSVVGYDDPTGQPTPRAMELERGKKGDPPSWPPNSGVVVVVADSGDTATPTA